MLLRLMFLFVALVSGGFAAASEPRDELMVWDRVYLVPDPNAGTVGFQMIVNAGCADEADGDCRGLAHYLEHLLLVGRNAEHGDNLLRFFGDGSSNGWTNSYATAYTHRFPLKPDGVADSLDRLFGFYAARLKGFEIAPAEAERERNVVLQEYNLRYANNPLNWAQRQVDQRLLPGHPLGQWTSGTPATIRALTVADARAFHARWYSRANVHFVVTGNVPADTVRAAAMRSLGPVERGEASSRDWLRIPTLPPLEERIALSAREVTEQSVGLSRIASVSGEPSFNDLAANSIVSAFLASKLPGSPHAVLVEEKGLTDAIDGAGSRWLAPGVFRYGLAAKPAPDVSARTLGTAIETYLPDLARSGLPPGTLARLQRRAALADAAARGQPGTTTSQLVQWLSMPYGTGKLSEWPATVAALTEADVASFLRRLAADGRQVTLTLSPDATR